MNKYKILKILIIIFMILCILIGIVYLIFSNGNSLSPYERKSTPENEEMFIEENSEVLEKVKYRYHYYTIQLLTERYLTYIKDSLYDDSGIRDASREALYSIVDNSYLKEFNISDRNQLIDRYKDILEEEQIEVKNIYNLRLSDNIELFLVKGLLVLNNQEIEIFVKLDTLNKTFSVFPDEYLEKYEYSENSNNINIDKGEINKNEYNTFKFSDISDEKMALSYFNILKSDLVGNAEVVYNYLNEEYRNKRFENIENFNKYIEDNKAELSQIEMDSYLINYYTDYTEFVCRDQYENIYIFRETAINEFTLLLDDYTLDYQDEEYLNEYNSSTDQYKVANNINKWIKMLNNRDYQAAYNVLEESFRERFGGEEGFETYMRKAFPLHYEIEYGEFTEESGIYTQKITLTDITGESDGKIIKTILMDLGEGTDFVMSFNTTRADVSR